MSAAESNAGPQVPPHRNRLHVFFAVSALTASALVSTPIHAQVQVTTSQYDNARTGADTQETILSPRNVNANQFGKLFTFRVDGDVYAQPLYVPHVKIAGKGTHNVVYIATEYDSVYAFDADTPADLLWHASFVDSSKDIEPLTPDEVNCPFIVPTIGITSTPVIDAGAGTIYILARTRQHSQFFQNLHALDIATGAERPGSPVTIKASAAHKTLGLVSNPVNFDAVRENPRAALLLLNGKVYLTWASSCDVGPYHGWVMAYDARTLQQSGSFNSSPDDDQSGIWAGDAGPAADTNGNVFVATGNGAFDAASRNGRDYGDSVLKLGFASDAGLTVSDYFTPFDQEKLNNSDNDLGSGGPLLLPDQRGPHPHLLVVGGKGAMLYVIDRDHMGKFHSTDNSHAVQTISTPDMIFGAPAYWNSHVYTFVSNDVLRDYKLQDGKLSLSGKGTIRFVDPGATPAISANEARDGIVWVIETKGFEKPDRPAILRAFDATNVAHELYNSTQNDQRDYAGRALRFTIPTVANGRVYIGTKNEVNVYGLLPAEKNAH